ncbi:MAG: DNA-binding response regulator [Paenibacillaceae bacterium]|jgi:two-component system response regulator YesN|nr:DNA-binding response regulator [Paenibacillaceae bacterium]
MSPIRCLIVDDEELIIQRLQLFFHELSLQEPLFTLAGVAYSGAEGLQLAEQEQPDLIITDIRMPEMDGITMIEQMKKSLPRAEYLILTAYSDFHYAKRAIQMGVSDYIVKVPLDEEELLRAMRKAADSLQQARKKEEELRKLDMSIMKNRHRVFKQLFRELLQGEARSAQAEEIMLSYDMHLFQDRYCCLVIEMDQYTTFINQYPLSDQSILKYGILNIIEETLKQYGNSLACHLERHRFIGFVSWPHLHSAKENEQKFWSLAQAIAGNIRTYLKQPVSVGIAPPAVGWKEMAAAYAQALEACAEHYYAGEGTIVTPCHPAVQTARNEGPIRQRLLELAALFHREFEDMGEVKSRLHSIQEEARRERLSRHVMTGLLKEFLAAAHNRMAHWKPSVDELMENSLPDMSLAEQMDYISAYLAGKLTGRDIPLRPDIAKAIDYIETNLSERLSLQMIARQVNLAPAYFSTLFKKEMKESLVDYINRKKIELAVELLKVRNYSNQELCDMVGIMNEAYFCTLFKQKTGSTPKQYLKQMKE